MILIFLIHITDPKRNIRRKYRKICYLNTQLIGTALTLELQTAQQLQ